MAAIDKFLTVKPEMLLEAVVAVQNRYHLSGKKPGSDRWLQMGRFNNEMMQDVENEWNRIYCRDMGCEEPPDFFPYTVGHVTGMWVDFRKDSNDAKVSIYGYFNIPILRKLEAEAPCTSS